MKVNCKSKKMKSNLKLNRIKKRLRIKPICKEKKKTVFWTKSEKERKPRKKLRRSSKS